MIEYIQQDISTITRGVVAHGVNCQGVMGSGVAAALRRKYPQIFTVYKLICDMHTKNPEWMLGMVDVVDINRGVDPDLFIVNCFTQERYGRDGQKYANLDAVAGSLERCFGLAQGFALPLFVPKIGCGLGGLSWENEVEPVVQKLADKYGMVVHVCTL